MSTQTNPLSKVKLVYKPSKTLTKIALLGVIVLSTVTLIALHAAIGRSQAQAEAMRAEAAALEQQNSELENRIDGGPDVEQIAGEELGLVDPDKVIFDINP